MGHFRLSHSPSPLRVHLQRYSCNEAMSRVRLIHVVIGNFGPLTPSTIGSTVVDVGMRVLGSPRNTGISSAPVRPPSASVTYEVEGAV
ncbi:MAG: hypothetical protein QOE15_2692 [Acidimicrobiaceae bacterium]|nr:hypothetical protein [Acidimicrobiaceae bacterium]